MSINYEQIAQKHNISDSAVQHLAQAIAQGNGLQAQFNHPELGGMGQWMPTMLMIGDAFNYQLKARVDILCHELATAYKNGEFPAQSIMSPMNQSKWWAPDYNNPTFSGGQNNIRYVYFAQHNRLMIQRDGQESIYDTSPYTLSGVSQQQMNNKTHLVFHTKDGKTIDLTDLKQVTT